MKKSSSRIRAKVEQLMNLSFYVFVPSAAIGIFSDNIIFETICLIAGIVFAVAVYIEKQI